MGIAGLLLARLRICAWAALAASAEQQQRSGGAEEEAALILSIKSGAARTAAPKGQGRQRTKARPTTTPSHQWQQIHQRHPHQGVWWRGSFGAQRHGLNQDHQAQPPMTSRSACPRRLNQPHSRQAVAKGSRKTDGISGEANRVMSFDAELTMQHRPDLRFRQTEQFTRRAFARVPHPVVVIVRARPLNCIA